MTYKQTTNNRLMRLRIESGLTADQVAYYLRVSARTYREWESGSAPVPRKALPYLASIFRVHSAALGFGDFESAEESQHMCMVSYAGKRAVERVRQVILSLQIL